MSSSLLELRKYVLNQRKDPFTDRELQAVLTGNISSELVLYLLDGLIRGKIKPDNLLIQSIAVAQKPENLIPVGLALRYGANPNLYVNVPDIGNLHILGYPYLRQKMMQPAVLNGIIIMLIASGARSVRKAFDDNGGRAKNGLRPAEGETIMQWIQAQQYETIIPRIQQNFEQVAPDYLTALSVLLNRNDLIKERPDAVAIIRNHAMTVFDKHLQDYPRIEYPDALSLTLFYLNYTAFKILIEKGVIPSYFFMNNILIKLKEYAAKDDAIAFNQVREMLNLALEYGAELDEYQFEMINQTSAKLAKNIITIYDKPFWQKECRITSNGPSVRLKSFVASLDISPNQDKKTLCSNLAELNKVEPSKLKQAGIEKQKTKVSSDMATANEFIDGVPDILCRNRSVIDGSPYNYSSFNMAYYKDAQGVVWCFSRKSFNDLLDSRKNPYTEQPLPRSFLQELTNKNNLIAEYGLKSSNITFSMAVDDLKQADKIRPVNDTIIQQFIKKALAEGISETELRSLTKKQMLVILSSLDIKIQLQPLTKAHAFTTFALALTMLPDKENVWRNIRMQTEI